MDKLKTHGYYSVFELFIGATNGFDNFGENFDWRGNNSNIWGKEIKEGKYYILLIFYP